MDKRLSFLAIVAGLILSVQPLESQELPFSGSDTYRALLQTAYSRLERLGAVLMSSEIPFRVDGGGDGGDGSGDGGSGTGGDSSGGDSAGGDSTGGDSTSGDSASNGAAGAAAAAAAATSDDAAAAAATTTTDNADPDAPNTEAVSVSVAVAPTDPSDPTTEENAVTPELDAIMSIPTTDPRGGAEAGPTVDNGFPSAAILQNGPEGGAPGGGGPGAGGPTAPVDVAINAVIVSAAQSPWDAIKKTPGVRNVIVTGGIIALGKTPIPGEIPGGGPEPAWLRVIPDPRLLNGSVVPPVVPNIIDIRIMNCPMKVVENPGN
jgi:hypothetical protein